MALRKIIVVGDKTTTSGVVLPNANSTFSVGDASHKVALIGGQASCLACKGTGIIAKAGGPRRMNFMGEVALENDIVLCKCPEPPKLVATLHQTMTYDDQAESLGSVSSAAIADQHVTAIQKIHDAGSFDEAVHVSQEGHAIDLAGLPFLIETEDGRRINGKMDANGELPRVATDEIGNYEIFWGDDALERGQ
ncbi:PAAR domain-containing protein [Collimonas sp. OK412]|jgi:hypothetical protein|uniref:PAAR domain-containing protein n=1 Tax=Collimonas sp. (strain OK412) TaxID=1801619 RepID=UPI0008F3670D|nr:PAAR domain-containing protein [Collimonas sp. OK412]SFB90827.1 PAAR motif-containing protein [Collimonas sp. OK412]